MSINFVTQHPANTTLEVRDLMGRLVSTQKIKATQGTNIANLDFSTFVAGMYIVSLNNGTDVVTAKVVKQ
ncbi:MAG: T9SS type A sorting domain-containing protein [Sphingobacteriales bacterium]|nr:T9SS type A sorting domain-containing protein [Sphingobacteriales bacterium]